MTPPKVLFAAPARTWDDYRAVLPQACAEAGVAVEIAPDHPPEQVDWIVFAPGGEALDFARFPGCGAS